MDNQLEGIYGPSAPADYQPGDRVRFLREGREQYGELLHVRAPGAVVQGGVVHPTLYVVDDGSGWPIHVRPGDILWEKEEG